MIVAKPNKKGIIVQADQGLQETSCCSIDNLCLVKYHRAFFGSQ